MARKDEEYDYDLDAYDTPVRETEEDPALVEEELRAARGARKYKARGRVEEPDEDLSDITAKHEEPDGDELPEEYDLDSADEANPSRVGGVEVRSVRKFNTPIDAFMRGAMDADVFGTGGEPDEARTEAAIEDAPNAYNIGGTLTGLGQAKALSEFANQFGAMPVSPADVERLYDYSPKRSRPELPSKRGPRLGDSPARDAIEPPPPDPIDMHSRKSPAPRGPNAAQDEAISRGLRSEESAPLARRRPAIEGEYEEPPESIAREDEYIVPYADVEDITPIEPKKLSARNLGDMPASRPSARAEKYQPPEDPYDGATPPRSRSVRAAKNTAKRRGTLEKPASRPSARRGRD